LKQAGISVLKTLADFDWTFNPKIPKAKLVELASARFVESHSGVLLIGPGPFDELANGLIAEVLMGVRLRDGREDALRQALYQLRSVRLLKVSDIYHFNL
jgi:hypothetical protein